MPKSFVNQKLWLNFAPAFRGSVGESLQTFTDGRPRKQV